MKHTLPFASLRLIFEVLMVLILVLLVFSLKSAPGAASAQTVDVPESPQALYWYVCNAPNHIGLFKDRVHIYCETTTPIPGAPALGSGILWFAVPTSPDTAAASRYMSLLQTSVLTAKEIWLMVDPSDTSGVSFGCAASDCRRIYGMEMR